jgi:structural maintenance of chromosome 1
VEFHAVVRALFFLSARFVHTRHPPRCSISVAGNSEYRLNDKVINYSAYNAALVKHNILVKAKNFLVFQGDVEAVAQQSPRDLTRLIEQISGSLELEKEYETAKLAQERATENATTNFTKRRGITGEIKQYKEQKTEADKFDGLVQERVRAALFRFNALLTRSTGRPAPPPCPLQTLAHRGCP